MNPTLVTVDVFATILMRTADEHAAWRAATLAAAPLIQKGGLAIHDLIELRHNAEKRLSAELLQMGRDPEFSHRDSLEQFLLSGGAGERAESEAAALAATELACEARLTRPILSTITWLADETAKGHRVVAVSDTRYTGSEISALLEHHRVTGIARIYSSADYAASKFSGRLFDIVASEECVEPSRILHVGDNLVTDCFAPAQRRIQVRRKRRTGSPAGASPLPIAPYHAEVQHDGSFATGYRTIGPVLVAFVRLVMAHARRDGIERLAFVARDGHLPLEVARIIAENNPITLPELSYVHLSRRAMACAYDDLLRIGESPTTIDRLLRELSIVRGGRNTLERLCSMFGLPAELLTREASRLNMSRDNTSELRRLLSDRHTATALRECIKQQRSILTRYLIQEKLLTGSTALVDIGWRGSIQRALSELPKPNGSRTPPAYYLGLWDEAQMVSPPAPAEGILCDQRRGRVPREAAAWQVACLLESVCRANHGMVTGYEEQSDGTILPVHSENGAARAAERNAEDTCSRLREGALAYARWFAREAGCAPPVQEDEIRQTAQKMLFRLAFFPRPEERAVGRLFVHSEPTSNEWSMPLIMAHEKGLTGWLKGIRSPWKGGYFRDTGGVALAAAYCLAENTLSLLPSGTKMILRKLLVGTE